MFNSRSRRDDGRWFACAIATFVLSCLCLGLAQAAPAYAELKPVTARRLPQVSDARLDTLLAEHKGQPVIVNFWATWCAPCREEMPQLQRTADRWRERRLAVVTVAVEDKPKDVEDFLWEADVRPPVVDDRDKRISRAWGAYALPATFLLDNRHRIRYRALGPIDWDGAVTDRILQSLFNSPRKGAPHGSP